MAGIAAMLRLVRTQARIALPHPPPRRGYVHPGHLSEPGTGLFVGDLSPAGTVAPYACYGVVEFCAVPVQHPQSSVPSPGPTVHGSWNCLLL